MTIDVEVVDLGELLGLGLRRAGHAGQLLVLAEVVLEGDRRERLVLPLDLHLLLGLDRLVEAVAPAPPGHQAAGELVDDDDLAVLDHVVDVELEERVGAERLVDVVEQRHVGPGRRARRGSSRCAEQLLGLGHAALGERDRLVLLVHQVVAGGLERLAVLGLGVAARHRPGLEPRDDPVDLVVEVGRLLGGPRDDERRPGLVDQDAVHFVDDRVVVPALDVVGEIELHVVAQVVEAELVVGAVGDVAPVGDLALGVVQVVLDDADRHAEEAVDPPHPLGVAACQVVVDRDDVDAPARQRVQVGRQRRDQRLALAGLHLGDLAVVQDDAADQLHVEVPHVDRAAPGLPHDGERLGEQVVDGRALRQPLPELGGLRPQRLVGERLDSGFEGVVCSTSGRSRFSSRSFCVPMTFARSVSSMEEEDRLPEETL